MKKRDLEKQLELLGWQFLRHGGSHELWTNGTDTQAVPRHGEINEMTAKAIIRVAAAKPPKPEERS